MGTLPIIKGIRGHLNEISNLTLRQQMQTPGSTLTTLHHWARERLPVSLTTDAHPFKSGDAIWVKEWNVQSLKPLWRCLFTVILSTPTPVKVTEVGPWIHYSRVKLASRNRECIPDPSTLCKLTTQEKQSAAPEAPGDCNPASATPEAD